METKLIKEEIPDKDFADTERITSLRSRNKGLTSNGKTHSDRNSTCTTPDSPESARLTTPTTNPSINPNSHQTQSTNVSSQQTLNVNTIHISSSGHHRTISPNLVTPQRHSNSISPPLHRVQTTSSVSPSPGHHDVLSSTENSSPTPLLPLTVDSGFNAGLSNCTSHNNYYNPARYLTKVKRFLCTLVQFGTDISADTGERVRTMVLSLVSSNLSVEEFHQSLQEVTNFPLRPFVMPFLRTYLPLLQREVHNLARAAKQPTIQYIRTHDHIVLDPTFSPSEASEIFFQNEQSTSILPKRRASDSFYENVSLSNALIISSTNSTSQSSESAVTESNIPAKRHIASQQYHQNPFLLSTTPSTHHSTSFFLPNSGLTNILGPNSEYPSQIGSTNHTITTGIPTFNTIQHPTKSDNEDQNGYRQFNTNTVSSTRGDEEWKNIHVMLNCILSMVEKTKRALTILQQRNGQDNPGDWLKKHDIGIDLKKTANEIMIQAVRQTEDRVAEVKRKAEEAVNEVKKQAVIELQKAVQLAESKATDLVATERAKMEKMLLEARKKDGDENSQSPPNTTQEATSNQNSCWNCGRKANETCSGCNIARYCGAFCQHKDWENHHTVCCQQNNLTKLSLASTAASTAATTNPTNKTNSRDNKPLSQTPRSTEIPLSNTPVSSTNLSRTAAAAHEVPERSAISK